MKWKNNSPLAPNKPIFSRKNMKIFIILLFEFYNFFLVTKQKK